MAEERRKAKMERQELSQYFNPSVVGRVNRTRRIHSSRRTRVLILLDEPRTSRLAAAVFTSMLVLIFVSVALVVIDSMSPPEEMRHPLWCVEVGVSVQSCYASLAWFTSVVGVCVSNHVGRAEGSGQATIDALPEIAEMAIAKRTLKKEHGVSTVLVMGGSGDYFDVADLVIMMRDFQPFDVSAEARRIAVAHASQRRRETDDRPVSVGPRQPLADSFDPSRGRRAVKIDAKAIDLLLYGTDPIDLRGVEQIVDRSQTRAIGLAIHLAAPSTSPSTSLADFG